VVGRAVTTSYRQVILIRSRPHQKETSANGTGAPHVRLQYGMVCPTGTLMGRLWKGNTTGFGYEAIACFERGLVWDGHEPGFDYQAVASYGKRRIWTGANKGFNYESIGCYDNERIWNGHDPGFQYEAIGYYSEGLIWEGNNEGFNYEAVGAYEGSPVGAAAAAVIYLLGGGEASDTSSSSDEESEESDDDSHDDASDDDDDYDYDTDNGDNGNDAPSYVSEPYPPQSSKIRPTSWPKDASPPLVHYHRFMRFETSWYPQADSRPKP